MVAPIYFFKKLISESNNQSTKSMKNDPVGKDLTYHRLTLCLLGLFGTRDLFNISYSRELYLFSKFLHFEEIVRVKIAVFFEMIASET